MEDAKIFSQVMFQFCKSKDSHTQKEYRPCQQIGTLAI
jgi:hypothetical protein